MKEYRDNLLITRLLLAVMVIWCHAYPFTGMWADPLEKWTGFNAGWWAVNGFICISGFCIVQSRERSASGAEFLWKRFLRVYPAYAVCMLILVVAYSVAPTGHEAFNLVTFGPVRSLNVPIWTVQIEEIIYLGVTLLFALNLLNRYVAMAVFAVFLGFGFNHLGNLPVGDMGTTMADSFMRLLPFFCMGALLYYLKVPMKWYLTLGVAVALVVAVALGYAYLAAPLLFPYLVISLGTTRQLFKIPDLSYGVYLWNWPVLMALSRARVTFDPTTMFFMATAAALCLAFLSRLLIEKPASKLRGLVGKKALPAVADAPVEPVFARVEEPVG
jgi:peptidoglycan/LPS O-acetylase OafA/YrhL